MGDSRTDRPPIDELFGVLGHPIRVEILAALLEDWQAAYTEPVSYATLMDGVDMTDSGKFNYHLQQLLGVYVHSVESGYVPTAAGTALRRAVIAHRPDRDDTPRQIAVDSTCPACDAELIGVHERGFLSIECRSCETWAGLSYTFPQNGLAARSDERVLEAFRDRYRRHLELARSGQCPFCAATTTVTADADAVGSGEHTAEIACDTCSFRVGSDIAPLLLGAPRVIGVLRDCGIAPGQYQWDLPEFPARPCARDPLRVRIEIEGPDATAAIVVDETLGIRAIET